MTEGAVMMTKASDVGDAWVLPFGSPTRQRPCGRPFPPTHWRKGITYIWPRSGLWIPADWLESVAREKDVCKPCLACCHIDSI